MNWYSEREKFEDTVKELRGRYNKLEEQKMDLEFYQRACVDKFYVALKSEWLPQFPFDKKFFKGVLDGDKENTEWCVAILQQHLCDKIKKIDKVVCCGFHMYAISCHFTVDDKKYSVTIPIRDNIQRSDFIFDNYVNWDIGRYEVLMEESEHSWLVLWGGYDLDDCNVFRVRESD